MVRGLRITVAMRASLACLAVACAVSPARADALIINPDSMHGLSLVIIPATAADLRTARDAGLATGVQPWAGQLGRVAPDLAAGPAPSPFHDRQRLDLVDPDDLLGISGIPVMLEGDARVGIMPYVSGTTVSAATVGANPTPYPDVPQLVAWPDLSGWRVASVSDGVEHVLVGVAPAAWTIEGGGVVGGIGVLIDEHGRAAALLGQPVLRNTVGTTRSPAVHLVHL